MTPQKKPDQTSDLSEQPVKAETKRKSREPLYGELKKPTMISLTPTASGKLEALASEFSLSRSELIEQIARGMISIGSGRSA
jgi:hypothetical protein